MMVDYVDSYMQKHSENYKILDVAILHVCDSIMKKAGIHDVVYCGHARYNQRTMSILATQRIFHSSFLLFTFTTWAFTTYASIFMNKQCQFSGWSLFLSALVNFLLCISQEIRWQRREERKTCAQFYDNITR